MATVNGFMTAKEVSVWLKISLPWVRKLTQEKRIPHVRIGSRVLFRPEEVEAWIRSHEVKAVEVSHAHRAVA